MSESWVGPSADDDTDAARGPDKNKRARVVGGGLLGALVLVGGGYLLLGGGAGASPAGPATSTNRASSHAATDSIGAPAAVPVAVSLPVVRNPFKALYVAPTPAASGAGADGGTPAPSASTVNPPIGPTTPVPAPTTPPIATPAPPTSAPPSTTPPPTTPPPSTPPPTTPPPTPKTYPLQLVGVAGPATDGSYLEGWEVGGINSITIIGQRFGKHGELVVVSISPPSGKPLGVMLKVGGDAPIFVAIGDTIQVR